MQTNRTTICLVRHGETDWNAEGRIQGQEDTPLNATGHVQAQYAARYLQQWQWDVLVASPLARAKDTALHIGSAVGLSLARELPQLMERDYGQASGLSAGEIATRFPEGDVPGIESRAHLQTRVMDGLHALAKDFAGQRVIAVAHGGVINAVLAHLSRGKIGSGKTKLGNACISLLHYRATNGKAANDSEMWEIEYYNYQEHIPAAIDKPVATHIGVNSSVDTGDKTDVNAAVYSDGDSTTEA